MIVLRLFDRKTGEEIATRQISTEFSVRAIHDVCVELEWDAEIVQVRR